MNVGWNYRREHLPLSQRSHYVITDGGDQPNVVPPTASVWYYFRQITYPGIKEMWAIGDTIAQGAAMMTDTDAAADARARARRGRSTSTAPSPQVTLARTSRRSGCRSGARTTRRSPARVQKELGARETGLTHERRPSCGGPVNQATNTGGGSDDIGDISWNVPTVTLSYPVEHSRACRATTGRTRMAMATPIAHKGVTAGAKVQAMTLVDLLLKPEVITAAWDYFKNVQTQTQKYEPLIRPQDQPAIELNRDDHGEVPRADAEVSTTIRRSTRRTSNSWASSTR